mmetsp:Transcript_3608/g.6131  ORF Transcript_3608/g.6131 Transcript_3608/m.6131 type:complete len:125 (-) Transcript_3608:466-840(-)
MATHDHLRHQTVYPITNFKFGQKSAKVEKDTSVSARMSRMRNKYETEGPRRSVEAVLVVHQHNHPHILLLQAGNSYFKLPGGRLRPGEEVSHSTCCSFVGSLLLPFDIAVDCSFSPCAVLLEAD